MYNTSSNSNHRGSPATGPVSPYAFTSTPQLASVAAGSRPQGGYQQGISASTSVIPQIPMPAALSATSKQGPSLLSPSPSSNDTSVWSSSSGGLSSSSSMPSVSSTTAAKPSPDRYRKTAQRMNSGETTVTRLPPGSAMPSGSGMAAVNHLYSLPVQSTSSPSLTYQSYRGSTYTTPQQAPTATLDDSAVGRAQNSDPASRYRRRSLGAMEPVDLSHDPQSNVGPHPTHAAAVTVPSRSAQPQRPDSSHTHSASSESIASTRSGRSSRPTSARQDNHPSTPSPSPVHLTPVAKQDVRVVNVPSRPGNSTQRQPSPLSRPMNLNQEPPNHSPPSLKPVPQHIPPPSPAAQQLAALNDKDAKKGRSKLRRAFSFGSAAELRKATAQNNFEKNVAAQAPNQTQNKRISRHEEELDPESARIARKQEAAGLGESIYSGQGNFFTGSTDNLSISSTASSASVMLRKMGKGVKKSTRSLVGLFRPKSVIGVPAADGPVNAASAVQVSMLTVEAERAKVNINLDPHDQARGGTGFPKLERNSIDASKLSIDGAARTSETKSRRSIVGGERERAEVLAAVKKGILKRTDSTQPSPRIAAADHKAPDFSLPQIPHMNDSPQSSAPSTPGDEPPRSGHRRTESVAIEGNEHSDYFTSVTRLASMESKSNSPFTPQTLSRNISFSPRIQFHDTWPSQEYDRRGDIATCNRLTPMLAQQIKEELNSFKMEMEVHETSKVYTHFF